MKQNFSLKIMFSWVKQKMKFEVFVLVGCCAEYDGVCLSTFRDCVSLPPSRVEQSQEEIFIFAYSRYREIKSAKYRRLYHSLSRNFMHPGTSNAFGITLVHISAMMSQGPRRHYPPGNKNERSLYVSERFHKTESSNVTEKATSN